jgi:hypothetical protein
MLGNKMTHCFKGTTIFSVAVWSKANSVFDGPRSMIVFSNSVRGMDGFPRLFCAFCCPLQAEGLR